MYVSPPPMEKNTLGLEICHIYIYIYDWGPVAYTIGDLLHILVATSHMYDGEHFIYTILEPAIYSIGNLPHIRVEICRAYDWKPVTYNFGDLRHVRLGTCRI